MTFVFEGVLVRKNLPASVREKLVLDTYKKKDKRTGRVDLYRRVSYYDPAKRFNVPVGSKKIGEIDPETGEVHEILRKQSPVRKIVASAILEISDRAEKQLDDQRQQTKVIYGLPVTLDVSILAAMGGCNGSKQIAEYWENNRPLLQERWGIDFPKSNPSIATISRLMQLVDPEQFQTLYQELIFPLLPLPNQRGVDKDVVAIDGQVVRASRTELDRQHQMLSFYSTETGIAFCQVRIDTKSNEKPAALKLAQRLDLSGTIVTGDAMHCERKLLETLMCAARADYCTALKMNQSQTATEVQDLFEMHEAEVLVGTQKDRGHGRVEVRTTYVLPGHLLSAPIKKRWFGIEYGSIVKQVSQRTVSLTKAQMAMNKACDKEEKKVEAETTTQTRYYLTSLSPLCPEIVRNVQRAVRNHWGIENGLHHVLDVDFGQDAMQAKNANYVTNMTQLNKMALAIIELVRRRKIKAGEMTERTSVSSIIRSLQNNPRLAGEYLDTFVQESALAAATRPKELQVK